MPAKKTKISYSPAATTPSGRKKPKSYVPPMNKPKGRTDLTDFVETHRENGETTQELIHQFQEECQHTRVRVEIARTPTKRLMKCQDCGDIKETH